MQNTGKKKQKKKQQNTLQQRQRTKNTSRTGQEPMEMSGQQHKQSRGEETQQGVMQHGTASKQNGTTTIQRCSGGEQTREISERTKPTEPNDEAEKAGTDRERDRDRDRDREDVHKENLISQERIRIASGKRFEEKQRSEEKTEETEDETAKKDQKKKQQ